MYKVIYPPKKDPLHKYEPIFYLTLLLPGNKSSHDIPEWYASPLLLALSWSPVNKCPPPDEEKSSFGRGRGRGLCARANTETSRIVRLKTTVIGRCLPPHLIAPPSVTDGDLALIRVAFCLLVPIYTQPPSSYSVPPLHSPYALPPRKD
ncbi:hypothetical protein NPIL_548011 [Nephila pilipes]|uniref:Uncharacterized protein n=1 Tax=Nephila pilipes TaxID=299642 RepID=A0A8X6PQU4_NEPPI|nr:hypothetical protein NPIL_548011 [Nephila pilipes]